MQKGLVIQLDVIGDVAAVVLKLNNWVTASFDRDLSTRVVVKMNEQNLSQLMIPDLSGVPLLSDPDPGPGELGGGGHRGHGEAGDHVQSGEARPQAGQGLGVARADAHHLRHDAPLLILVSENQKIIII